MGGNTALTGAPAMPGQQQNMVGRPMMSRGAAGMMRRRMRPNAGIPTAASIFGRL